MRDLYTLMGLTQECFSYKPNETEVARRNSVLVAENKKLRELVQYILDENYGDDWFSMKAEEIGLEARY